MKTSFFSEDFWAAKRQTIQKRLRAALGDTPPALAPTAQYAELYQSPVDSSLEEVFATHFTALGGYFRTVADEKALKIALGEFLANADCMPVFCAEAQLQPFLPENSQTNCKRSAVATFTSCQALIAQHGSILMTTAPTRAASALPDWHIVVAQSSQIVPNLGTALALVDAQQYSMHSIITGASRTADIEKTLVMGAHGPKKICVFLVLSS